ncbi:MAG TPA: PP2C family serine/threonine-protein phosphatase [Miltoncostaeaceae bacterium]|nr:PP2C family serine/threonine-protein phosphatase [Miltoncostaeaceae bacterium]
MIGGPILDCAVCGAPLQPADRFCEECGSRAGAQEQRTSAGGDACHACGAPAGALGDDGSCRFCGTPARDPGDRVEVDLVVAAAITDRGRVRARNEDAMHLDRVGPGKVVAVVCDGVSSSFSGDVAARTAASAAGSVLAERAGGRPEEAEQATEEAVTAARRAVERLDWTERASRPVPSCTFVSVVAGPEGLVVGWVGDSRAYWIASGESRRLTRDDSWAVEQVEEGLMSAAEADADPRAHAITRWIGADAPDDPPRIATMRPTGPGRLLLCSDGLWNHLPDPVAIEGLLDGLPATASAVAAARALADAALAAGGQDNITVVVIDVDPGGPGSEWS